MTTIDRTDPTVGVYGCTEILIRGKTGICERCGWRTESERFSILVSFNGLSAEVAYLCAACSVPSST